MNIKKIIAIFFSFVVFILSFACSMTLKNLENSEKMGLYHKAANGYKELYSKTNRKNKEKRAKLAMGAARNYISLRQFDRAYSSLQNAKNAQSTDSTLYRELARVAMALGKIDEAEFYYKKYDSIAPKNIYSHIGLLSINKFYRDSIGQKLSAYQISRKDNWNSSRCDFAPSYSRDFKTLYFTSNRGFVDKKSLSEVTGLRDNDIYLVCKDANDLWSNKVDTLGGEINTLSDEGISTFSSDASNIYFTKADSSGVLSIFYAKKSSDGNFSSVQKLSLWSDSTRMATHPSISSSGSKMAFVSQGSGAIGGTDIFLYDIGSEHPSEPYNIGLPINTALNESYPNLVNDSLLYFASEGHLGYGGLDIFKAVLLPSGQWELSNLGKGINSNADDFSIAFLEDSTDAKKNNYRQFGIFASSRLDARGYPHLYEFKLANISTIIEGYVMDIEEYAIEGAKIRIVGNNGQNVTVNEAISNEEGYWSMNISGDVDYVMLASAEGYLNKYARFRTDSLGEDAVYNIDFILDSKGDPLTIEDVFYAFDSSVIKEEAFPILDKIYSIMVDNPDIRIKISSHADRIGTEFYNINLSKERAKSVLNYLTAKGIDVSRLEYEGLGFSSPRTILSRDIAKYDIFKEGDVLTNEYIQNLSEENQAIADQLNRRTEFRIID